MTDTQEKTSGHQAVGWLIAISCLWAGVGAISTASLEWADWLGTRYFG